MKKYILLLLAFFCFKINAQQIKSKSSNRRFTATERYFTFNPLALAEPQIAIGAGFGNRFSERSEYFTELSYIAKTPFYDYQANSLHGFRFLSQYRYHFFGTGKPLINLGLRKERNTKHNRFIGAEFRLKMYNFSGNNTFVNNTSNDTLRSISYNANAISLGGAILFGRAYNISKNGNWKIEITAGIGAKQKLVNFKGILKDYEIIIQRKPDGLAPPYIYEAVGMPYFPCSIRLKYIIN
jgi:hypothetical protein